MKNPITWFKERMDAKKPVYSAVIGGLRNFPGTAVSSGDDQRTTVGSMSASESVGRESASRVCGVYRSTGSQK